MSEREVWQFGDEYIYIDTGEHASEEDIACFKSRVEEGRKRQAIQTEQRIVDEKAWHDKYDKLIKVFFGYEDDECNDCEHWDDDWLCYNLATALFDSDGGNLEEIKNTFPDHWEAALENYKAGNHDT